ncbi:MAG TPA: T9SS type A sorting domain-containing protein [Flavobacteriales bacterium]|nr:T9SS type A sorting domain-containing protein [Flavobacteriales bacterium]
MRSLLPLVMLVCASTSAQDCSIPFTAPQFDVRVDSNLWYGNAERFNGGLDSLRMNLYKPIGDAQTERPLVVLIHGGGFVNGHRNDLNGLSSYLASCGYAAATISYRLGYYGNGILDAPYAYDANEFRRAAYRAMLDAKGAIRFLKGRHMLDSTSTANVLALGASAGAVTALHAAYLDQPAEKPAGCGAIGQVQHFFNFYPRPDLGPVDGDLHLNGQDASLLGVINLFGAMLDTSYIVSSDDAALYSYHQTGDPVVGCGVQRPYWNLGLGLSEQLPWVHGSCSIDQRMQHLGFTSERYLFNLHNGNEHTVHDPVSVLAEMLPWMRALFCSLTSSVDMPQSTSFSVAPNPASSEVVITRNSSDAAMLELHDASGRMLKQRTFAQQRFSLDTSELPAGLYLIRLSGKDGVSSQRLVKE